MNHQAVSPVDDDILLDPHEMAFFKEAEASETPGKNMRLYRRNVKMTQAQLAEKLGTTKQAVSNMERGIRPISKNTTKELAKLFTVTVSNFI